MTMTREFLEHRVPDRVSGIGNDECAEIRLILRDVLAIGMEQFTRRVVPRPQRVPQVSVRNKVIETDTEVCIPEVGTTVLAGYENLATPEGSVRSPEA